MKRIVVLLLLLSVFCSLLAAGCAQKDAPQETTAAPTTTVPATTPPATTEPPATTQPPETTAPPTTAAVYVPAEVTLDSEVYYIDTRFWYQSEGECPEGYYQLGDEGWENVVAHMTTRALIESVLAYPNLLAVEASSQTWLLYILNQRIGIVEELLGREDLEWALFNYPAPVWSGEQDDYATALMENLYYRLKMYVYGADYLWNPEAEIKQVEVPW